MRNSPLRRGRTCLRRILPCLMLIMGLGPSSVVFAKRNIAHLRVRQTASQSLTLIDSSSPDFESTLDTYYPGLSQEAGYQQEIRPFLVIVRNDTSTPAVAYAIIWTAPNPPGWISPLRAMFVNRPMMYRPAMTYIRPDGFRLISPLYNVTPKEYEATPSFTRIYPASRFPSAKGVVSLETEVDGVVYRGGSFIGADKTHILQRYVAARFAARDEALAALNLIKSSTYPQSLVAQQLLQSLNQEIQRDGRATKKTLLARYVRNRGRSAQDLQRILSERGVGGLETVLQNLLSRSGGTANPSMFGKAYTKLSNNDRRVFSIIP